MRKLKKSIGLLFSTTLILTVFSLLLTDGYAKYSSWRLESALLNNPELEIHLDAYSSTGNEFGRGLGFTKYLYSLKTVLDNIDKIVEWIPFIGKIFQQKKASIDAAKKIVAELIEIHDGLDGMTNLNKVSLALKQYRYDQRIKDLSHVYMDIEKGTKALMLINNKLGYLSKYINSTNEWMQKIYHNYESEMLKTYAVKINAFSQELNLYHSQILADIEVLNNMADIISNHNRVNYLIQKTPFFYLIQMTTQKLHINLLVLALIGFVWVILQFNGKNNQELQITTNQKKYGAKPLKNNTIPANSLFQHRHEHYRTENIDGDDTQTRDNTNSTKMTGKVLFAVYIENGNKENHQNLLNEAVVRKLKPAFCIQRLGEEDEVFVNGAPVCKTTILKNKDLICVGDVCFLFVDGNFLSGKSIFQE